MGIYFWTPCIMEYASTEGVHYWKWAWLSILIVWIHVMCIACLLLLLYLVLHGVSTQWHPSAPEAATSAKFRCTAEGSWSFPTLQKYCWEFFQQGVAFKSVYNVLFDTRAKQCQTCNARCYGFGGSHPLLAMHAPGASASDYTWCTIIDHLIALLLWWECVQRLHGLAMATLLSPRPCQERTMAPSSH